MRIKFSINRAVLLATIVISVLFLAVIVTMLTKPDLVSSITNGAIGAGKNSQPSSKYLVGGTADDSTVIVKYQSSTSVSRINKVQDQTKTKTKKDIPKIDAREIQVSAGESVESVVEKLEEYPEVEYAEPNYLADVLITPNDPFYSTQWGLPKVSAPAAWDLAQGGYGPIAVVDTGVLSTHPDLAGEVKLGYDFVNGDNNATDDHGHGTHVSGIIAALTNNSTGVASIGYKGSIIPVKVLNSSGSGSYANVASGIIYAVDNGAKVINLSLGGTSSSITLQNAVNYANSKGAYVVAAAGNSATTAPLYPAACTGAIAISATDSSDNLASFSNYGSNIFSSAPGVNINSTYLSNSYRYMSGTSMATPQFSGLLELAIAYANSQDVNVSKQNMLNLIKTSSDKVGKYPYDQNGWNQYFGYGRINSAKLINSIIPAPTPTPSPSPSPSITPSPSPVPTATPTPPKSRKFNVVLNGTISHINSDKTVIKLRVKNGSRVLRLRKNTIVSIGVTKSTKIRRRGRMVSVKALRVGDKINTKATYYANKLTASYIIASGRR